MADLPQQDSPLRPNGSLRFEKLSIEVQRMILTEVIQSSNSRAEIAGLATVSKTWQILVEAKTFRNIRVVLEATNRTGANYLISILSHDRLEHLKELTIEIDWPYFLSAQASRAFSGYQATSKLLGSIYALVALLRCLEVNGVAGATGSTSQNLAIALQPMRPTHVALPNASGRVQGARQHRGPEVESMWAKTDMDRKLSDRQRQKLMVEMMNLFNHRCPIVPMVTSVAFPPDFFTPIAAAAFLSKFPNLASINLKPMSMMSNPDAWRTDFFAKWASPPCFARALHISKLTLGRSITQVPTAMLGMFNGPNLRMPDPDDLEAWSRYSGAQTDPRHSVYVSALRRYTQNLEALVFDHFVAEIHFYTCFFNIANLPDQTFQWARLQEVCITLYGDKHPQLGLVPPMAMHNGAHLSIAARQSVSDLFCMAGTAAAKMPRLNKMMIHIPRKAFDYLLAVTLQFAVKSRREASLFGLYGSTVRLDLWAAYKEARVEDAWTTSMTKVRKVLDSIEWHEFECPGLDDPDRDGGI